MPAAKNQTVTQKSDPWEEAQPFIIASLESYQELFESDPEGEFIVEERDENTLLAEQLSIDRATDGTSNSAGTASQAAVTEILNSGPYAESANLYTNVEALVAPTITAQFAGANRIGGAIYQVELARGLTDAYAPVALSARQMELSAKLHAAAIAEKVDTAALGDVRLLAGVGADIEAYAARKIAAPYIQKSRWLDATGTAGGFGGTTQKTQDSGSKGVMGALGGALSGAGTGFALGVPFGALAGGALGLLGGLG